MLFKSFPQFCPDRFYLPGDVLIPGIFFLSKALTPAGASSAEIYFPATGAADTAISHIDIAASIINTAIRIFINL
ncbi:MAG: hypothetical protein PHH68_06070 [Candidatus Omnitrophica bacterium]|jgi:hypothetical protein|nr:hypothetical protein [Candidatus Omnitrophota bacterium]MDD5079874.1 hypothetical protein [Candidatus Omnitrophota bacterium]